MILVAMTRFRIQDTRMTGLIAMGLGKDLFNLANKKIE